MFLTIKKERPKEGKKKSNIFKKHTHTHSKHKCMLLLFLIFYCNNLFKNTTRPDISNEFNYNKL